MKHSEIVKLLKLCKEIGVKSVKIGEFSVEFDSSSSFKSFVPPVKSHIELPNLKPGQSVMPLIEGLPTEDDFLYWSADQFEEIKEAKEGLK